MLLLLSAVVVGVSFGECLFVFFVWVVLFFFVLFMRFQLFLFAATNPQLLLPEEKNEQFCWVRDYRSTLSTTLLVEREGGTEIGKIARAACLLVCYALQRFWDWLTRILEEIASYVKFVLQRKLPHIFYCVHGTCPGSTSYDNNNNVHLKSFVVFYNTLLPCVSGRNLWYSNTGSPLLYYR